MLNRFSFQGVLVLPLSLSGNSSIMDLTDGVMLTWWLHSLNQKIENHCKIVMTVAMDGFDMSNVIGCICLFKLLF
jgi:hypothetical protein